MAARKTPSGGAKPDKLWRDALMVAIKRAGDNDPRPYIARIAERCVDMAVAGDMQAIKEIGDRLDGKPAQAVMGEDGGPVAIVFRWQNEGENGETAS